MKIVNVGVALTSLALAAGCGQVKQTTLSVRTGAATTQQAMLALDNGITLDRVRMVISGLKFESGETADATFHEVAGEQEDVKTDPVLIDLSGTALDGGINQVVSANVAAGTYEEVSFEIHKLDTAPPGFEDMVAAQASIIVDGTIDAAPFSFASSVDETKQLPGPVVIQADSNNVTLNIDPTGWFGSASARLDPRDEANRSQIESNIKSSISAEEDDDRDGHEDSNLDD